MTDDLQELNGVGPSREEDLHELGYDEYSDIAEADAAELSEEVPRLSEDKALELVVQSQNLTDLEQAEVEESDSADEDESQSTEQTDDEDVEAEEANDDSGDPDTVPLTLSFEGDEEYDTFFAAVYEYRNKLLRTNRDGVAEVYEGLLDTLRQTTPSETLEHELTPEELNDLHNAVRTQAVEYQGQSLITQMEALDRVEDKINTVREEYLF